MSVINVKVGTRSYQLACNDGEEKKLKQTAEELDKRITALSQQLHNSNESLLLVMSSLMLIDEFNEYKTKYEISKDLGKSQKDEEVSEVLNTISSYLETVIEKIEKS